MNRMVRKWMSGLGMLWLALATSGAIAQTFPHKPIRLVVPFPAGGGTDAMARTLGEALSREFGQPVLVENKAGAGTTTSLRKAPPMVIPCCSTPAR